MEASFGTTTKSNRKRKYLMKRSLATLACAVALVGTAFLTQAADKKSDPTGTWTWTAPAGRGGGGGGGGGGQTRTNTLKLKVDGDKVTGTLSGGGGRQGGAPREVEIEEGKLKGDEVSFQVTRTFQDNKMVQKYNGKVSGDTIKGKMESERNGEPVSRDWEAKRAEDKKKEKE
jgi:hypothetical protein